jgi:hypothetical protein
MREGLGAALHHRFIAETFGWNISITDLMLSNIMAATSANRKTRMDYLHHGLQILTLTS